MLGKNSVINIAVLPNKIEIIADLQQRFDVVGCPIDLDLYYHQHGQQKIFDGLQALYQPEYRDDQRLIVVQGLRERYSYQENLAGDSLIYLQKCLQELDISNYFVIVVSPNKDIAQELIWVKQMVSTDHCSMHFALHQGQFEKIQARKDTFCVVPWLHLHVTTQLDITPCCVADTSRPWGSLRTHTVTEIINGDLAKRMRTKMLNNQPCQECSNCYEAEKYGTSRRQRENQTHQALVPHLVSRTGQDGALENFSPVSLDLRFNNTCNLKCRTCDGVSSSRLALEEKKLFNNDKNFVLMPSKKLRSGVLEDVMQYLNTAESIAFNGGEPLIMDEHYAILNRLLACGHTKIQIYYNTNFSLLQHKQYKVFDYWKRFPNVKVSASIDGHGRVFEYVRHGAKWPDIQKNVITLREQCPHVTLKVASTLSVLSVESVMQLQKQWHEEQILDIGQFRINAVNPTHFYSLQTFKMHHKQTVSWQIDDHCSWLQSVGAVDLANEWRKVQTMMWAEDRSFTNRKLAPVHRARDQERQENFETVFPHLADLFR